MISRIENQPRSPTAAYDGAVESAFDVAICIAKADVTNEVMSAWQAMKTSENDKVRVMYRFCFVSMQFDLLKLGRVNEEEIPKYVEATLEDIKYSTFFKWDANLLATTIMRLTSRSSTVEKRTLEARRNFCDFKELVIDFTQAHPKIIEIARSIDAALDAHLERQQQA